MAENLPELKLEVNVPVTVRPWRAKVVSTKYGDRLVLTVKHEAVEKDVWLNPDAVNDLTTLAGLEVGKWEDTGKLKLTVPKGAPEIVICKRQPAGEKHAHTELTALGAAPFPRQAAAPATSAPASPPSPEPVLADSADGAVVRLFNDSLKRVIAAVEAHNLTASPVILDGQNVASLTATLLIARQKAQGL